MIKKIAALAATALFSLNASAGYIQYDLHGTERGLSGFIVQHDTDHSIAYFELTLNGANYSNRFVPITNDDGINLVRAFTTFSAGGPTSFAIKDTYGADHETNLSVRFGPSARGLFAYTASYSADLYANQPAEHHTGVVSGVVSVGVVDQILAAELDRNGGYWEGITRIVPTLAGAPAEVPEPTSLALLALGAAGLAGAARRRKTAP